MPDNDIVGVLAKLRKHIYVFRNRRGWKDALQNQCQATNTAFKQLVLNMPIRWNSTYHMVDTALQLQTPITALCASQRLDLSMRTIALTPND